MTKAVDVSLDVLQGFLQGVFQGSSCSCSSPGFVSYLKRWVRDAATAVTVQDS